MQTTKYLFLIICFLFSLQISALAAGNKNGLDTIVEITMKNSVNLYSGVVIIPLEEGTSARIGASSIYMPYDDTEDLAYSLIGGVGLPNGYAIDIEYSKQSAKGREAVTFLSLKKSFSFQLIENLSVGFTVILASKAFIPNTPTGMEFLSGAYPMLVAKVTF